MKKTSFVLGVALMLLATIGAFATAKHTSLTQVFYKSGPLCLPAFAEECDFTGAENCIEAIEDENGASLGTAQIYQVNDPVLGCQVPYSRTQP